MDKEQLAQAAERYADTLRVPTAIPSAIVPMLQDIARSSYIRGAEEALASQWISVDERLPKPIPPINPEKKEKNENRSH